MSIHVQSLNNPWLKTYPREEKGGTRKEEEVAHGRGAAALFLHQGSREKRARERRGKRDIYPLLTLD